MMRQAAQSWPRDALPRGTALHGFVIEAILGRGGFGITYQARDKLDQLFAIKECFPKQFAVRQGLEVLPTDANDAQSLADCRARFTREAKALTRLSQIGAAGNGVVKVTTFFEANGTDYIVMEYLSGQSLEALIRATPGGIAADRLADLLRRLLHALGCVHDAGLLHRDIKPSNIFLREDGRPVLIDFGATRAASTGNTVTFTQIFSEGYAPIEQFAGGRQGPFSDLYALGMTCYRAIGGTSIDSFTRQQALLRGKPDPLPLAGRVGGGRYPAPILDAIDAALHVTGEDRPQTVGAMLALLGDDGTTVVFPMAAQSTGLSVGIAETQPAIEKTAAPASRSEARPAPVPDPRPSRSRRWLWIAAAMIAVGGAGASVVSLLHQARLQAAADAEAAREQGAREEAAREQAEREKAAKDQAAKEEAEREQAASQAAAKEEAAKVEAAKEEAAKEEMAREQAAKTQAQLADDLRRADAAFIRKNYQAAAPWYRNAADLGDARAEHFLAWFYQNGWGVKKDYAEAMRWYKKAAEQGYAASQYNIGDLYLNGFGVKKDYAEAMRWIQKAAEQGNADALNDMGAFYQFGWGINTDYSEAMRWYRKAAEKGNATSKYNIGTLYERGQGVSMDYLAAMHWFKEAAAEGEPHAETEIGILYAKGLGVGKDCNTAKSYFEEAAKMSNKDAKEWLNPNGDCSWAP